MESISQTHRDNMMEIGHQTYRLATTRLNAMKRGFENLGEDVHANINGEAISVKDAMNMIDYIIEDLAVTVETKIIEMKGDKEELREHKLKYLLDE